MTIKKITSLFRSPIRLALLLIICAIALAITTAGVLAKRKAKAKPPTAQQTKTVGETVGVPSTGEKGVSKTTSELMQDQESAPVSKRPRLMPDHELPDRKNRPQNPNSKPVASSPDSDTPAAPARLQGSAPGEPPSAPPTPSHAFTVATLADTSSVPPDSMGAVGPSQFLVFVNGRIRTFNKTT